MRILVIEDDPIIAENLVMLLQHNHLIANSVRTVESALLEIDSGDYDALIIDWNLPDGTGLEICKELRSDNSTIPILMLTARTQMSDVVQGLEEGADEYITKPYRAPELLARLNALLRRKDTKYFSKKLKISNVTIDTNLREVSVDNKVINLSPKEYELLVYLFRYECEPVKRLDLLAHVWGGSIDTFSNTVDVHIRYLRKKLGSGAKILKTIKGVGYCVCEK